MCREKYLLQDLHRFHSDLRSSFSLIPTYSTITCEPEIYVTVAVNQSLTQNLIGI